MIRHISGDSMHKIFSAGLAAAVMAAGTAQAATTSTTFAVTATVQSSCTASAAALAFPAYTPGAGTLIGNTNIAVKCTKNTGFTVLLNAGATTGTAFAQRLMGSGANTLQYNLYTTAALGTIFGDGSTGTSTMTGTGAGVATATNIGVFGQLPDNATNQAAVPGAYTDTITVTVNY
jgi:spore coat protein U-like protein